jgi:hypothetical protein
LPAWRSRSGYSSFEVYQGSGRSTYAVMALLLGWAEQRAADVSDVGDPGESGVVVDYRQVPEMAGQSVNPQRSEHALLPSGV